MSVRVFPEYSVSAEEGQDNSPHPDPVEMREVNSSRKACGIRIVNLDFVFSDLRRWKLAEKVLDGDFYGHEYLY